MHIGAMDKVLMKHYSSKVDWDNLALTARIDSRTPYGHIRHKDLNV